jgi:integrase
MGVYERNGTWSIDYYFEGRRRREKIGLSKKLAVTVLRKRQVAIAEGKYLDRKRQPRTTFDEMTQKYIEWAKVNKRSWARDVRSFRYMAPFFSGKRLSEVTPFFIEGFKRKRAEQVSKRTVDIELSLLKHMYTKAMEWGLAVENPARSVKLFRPHNERVRFLGEEEVARLLDACEEYFRSVVTVAVHTGMRVSEILGLRWPDVDFDSGLIRVENTKNGRPRKVPMNETTRGVLLDLKKRSVCEWVFVQKDDRSRSLRDVRKPFKRALARAGITDFRFHDLRHTCASLLVMKGIDLYTVQDILGHRDARMTQRYSHLSPLHRARAVSVLDGIGHCLDTGWNSRSVVNLGIPNEKDKLPR